LCSVLKTTGSCQGHHIYSSLSSCQPGSSHWDHASVHVCAFIHRFIASCSISYAEAEHHCTTVCRSCRAGVIKWPQQSSSRCFCINFTM